MNILVETDNFGAVSINKNNAVRYYTFKVVSNSYTKKNKATIDENIIIYVGRVVDITYITKLKHGSKW